jgi:hypothetical protein
MVYVALATALVPYPFPDAMALTVEVADSVNAPVYRAEDMVGVDPSVV